MSYWSILSLFSGLVRSVESVIQSINGNDHRTLFCVVYRRVPYSKIPRKNGKSSPPPGACGRRGGAGTKDFVI